MITARFRRHALADLFFRALTRLVAVLVLLGLLGFLASLVWGSRDSFLAHGWSFLWTAQWDPVRDQYGAWAPLLGTILTSLVALVIAIPVSFGTAMFLTELAPEWLRRPL